MPNALKTFKNDRRLLRYKKGQSLFREGDEVKGIYFIYKGAVKVHQSWGGEKELILRFAAVGDLVGYRGQGSDAIFPISATALDTAAVCFISNVFLESTLKTNPCFLYAMMQLYARELRTAESRMRNLALMDVRGRIARALFTLQETFGLDEEGFIRVPVTRLDIGSFARTTYETVFRLFSDWSGAGIIDTSGKSIRIRDGDQLRGFTENR